MSCPRVSFPLMISKGPQEASTPLGTLKTQKIMGTQNRTKNRTKSENLGFEENFFFGVLTPRAWLRQVSESFFLFLVPFPVNRVFLFSDFSVFGTILVETQKCL